MKVLNKALARIKCESIISDNGDCSKKQACGDCPGNMDYNNGIGCSKNGWAATEIQIPVSKYYPNILISSKKWLEKNFPTSNIYVEED
jgi:hypothetical protein